MNPSSPTSGLGKGAPFAGCGMTADLSTSRSRLGETAPVEIRGYGLGGIPHFALLRIEHPGFVALH
jgi:hypothetical protein